MSNIMRQKQGPYPMPEARTQATPQVDEARRLSEQRDAMMRRRGRSVLAGSGQGQVARTTLIGS